MIAERRPIRYELRLGKRRLFGLLSRKKHGILRNRQRTYHTPVMGCMVTVVTPNYRKAILNPDGKLVVFEGYCWDFASGALDTPDMVDASLAHDVLCNMITAGQLPVTVQSKADRYFRQLLEENGTGGIRRWYCYLAVRTYQSLRGRW